jgi:hypothetical protein
MDALPDQRGRQRRRLRAAEAAHDAERGPREKYLQQQVKAIGKMAFYRRYASRYFDMIPFEGEVF